MPPELGGRPSSGQGRVGLVGQGLGGPTKWVGGRAGPKNGANFTTCTILSSFLTHTKRKKWRFLKALWGGAGVPTRAGGVDQGPWFRSQGRVGLVGQGLRGGVQGLRFRGGRWWGPQGRSNVCRIFLFLTRTKRRKMAFFEGCQGVPTGAGLVDGEVDQGPWFQGFRRSRAQKTGPKASVRGERVSYFFVSNAYKKKKNGEGCRYPPELAWWTGG